MQDYFLQLDVNDVWNQTILRDVIGSHVGHACLRNCSESAELTAVGTVIDGIDIDSLEFEFLTLTEQMGWGAFIFGLTLEKIRSIKRRWEKEAIVSQKSCFVCSDTLLAIVRDHNIDRLILALESYHKCDRGERILQFCPVMVAFQSNSFSKCPSSSTVCNWFKISHTRLTPRSSAFSIARTFIGLAWLSTCSRESWTFFASTIKTTPSISGTTQSKSSCRSVLNTWVRYRE